MDLKKLLQISDFTKHFLQMFSTKEVLSGKVDRAALNAAKPLTTVEQEKRKLLSFQTLKAGSQ